MNSRRWVTSHCLRRSPRLNSLAIKSFSFWEAPLWLWQHSASCIWTLVAGGRQRALKKNLQSAGGSCHACRHLFKLSIETCTAYHIYIIKHHWKFVQVDVSVDENKLASLQLVTSKASNLLLLACTGSHFFLVSLSDPARNQNRIPAGVPYGTDFRKRWSCSPELLTFAPNTPQAAYWQSYAGWGCFWIAKS